MRHSELDALILLVANFRTALVASINKIPHWQRFALDSISKMFCLSYLTWLPCSGVCSLSLSQPICYCIFAIPCARLFRLSLQTHRNRPAGGGGIMSGATRHGLLHRLFYILFAFRFFSLNYPFAVAVIFLRHSIVLELRRLHRLESADC